MINNFSGSELVVRTWTGYRGPKSIVEFSGITDFVEIPFSVKIIKYDILKSVT